MNIASLAPTWPEHHQIFSTKCFHQLVISINHYFPLVSAKFVIKHHQHCYASGISFVIFDDTYILLNSLIIAIFVTAIFTIKLTFSSPCQATVLQYNTDLLTLIKCWITGCTLYCVCVHCTTLDNIPTSYKPIWQRFDDRVFAFA